MIAWLEVHVQGRSTCPDAGVAKRDNFGVGLAGMRVVSFPDYLAVADDDRSDHWVGRCLTPAQACELEGPRHEGSVGTFVR